MADRFLLDWNYNLLINNTCILQGIFCQLFKCMPSRTRCNNYNYICIMHERKIVYNNISICNAHTHTQLSLYVNLYVVCNAIHI